MRQDIIERVYELANYIDETKSTVRQTAKIFNLSKSTVHNDVSMRLKLLDEKYYKKINKILQFNFAEKHIRGGEATKNKYKNKLKK